MGKLRYLDATGHTELDLETEADLARELFTKVLGQGGMAYNLGNHQVMREFDPQVGDIVLRDVFVGG